VLMINGVFYCDDDPYVVRLRQRVAVQAFRCWINWLRWVQMPVPRRIWVDSAIYDNLFPEKDDPEIMLDSLTREFTCAGIIVNQR
jgi:hypothetical protein